MKGLGDRIQGLGQDIWMGKLQVWMELQFLDMCIENFSEKDFRMGKFLGLGLL
jgi:hypothetical protein